MAVMNSFTKELDAELLPQVFPNFPEDKFVALAEEGAFARGTTGAAVGTGAPLPGIR